MQELPWRSTKVGFFQWYFHTWQEPWRMGDGSQGSREGARSAWLSSYLGLWDYFKYRNAKMSPPLHLMFWDFRISLPTLVWSGKLQSISIHFSISTFLSPLCCNSNFSQCVTQTPSPCAEGCSGLIQILSTKGRVGKTFYLLHFHIYIRHGRLSIRS